MKRNSAAVPLDYFPKFRTIKSGAESGSIIYFTQFLMFWISSVGPATCKVKIRSQISCIWLTYPHWLLTVSGYQGLSAFLWQSAQPDCYVSKLSDTVIPFVVARELLICAKSGILAQTPGSAWPAVFSPLLSPPLWGRCQLWSRYTQTDVVDLGCEGPAHHPLLFSCC